jgi:hypothetical protein
MMTSKGTKTFGIAELLDMMHELWIKMQEDLETNLNSTICCWDTKTIVFADFETKKKR